MNNNKNKTKLKSEVGGDEVVSGWHRGPGSNTLVATLVDDNCIKI
jgi:hypothetical protein